MSAKKQAGLANFISFLIFIAIFAFYFWALTLPFEYGGEHPDLYTVAINNIFGAQGYHHNGEVPFDPYIEIIETDSQGRVLFLYDESNDFGTALVIMQATDGEHVFYYQDDCYYPYAYSEPTPYDAKYTDLFTEEEIDALKELNDWNEPLNTAKYTSATIAYRKGEGALELDDDDFEEAIRAYADTLGYLDDDTLYRYHEYCGRDKYGKEIYYVYAIGDYALGEGVSPDSSTHYFNLALIFNADGSCPLSNIYEIAEETNLYNYIRAFKDNCGWNIP